MADNDHSIYFKYYHT